ncbi:DNA-binding transcriptional regulator [Micromonospora rosaria]|uniref:DNA-binding transcriptional regulator n=1 Tax=Micromonospora rosaria TaxID=47874 RepID=A0A136PJI8_9ACTN|nr:YafY family protein [Micromonospora rosaria]KXK58580.1 DNA-binding transcriptional regulator [Micromonospora rosaria]
MDTAGRLLRLLSLLQSRRDWSGPDLADRLGVTVRTVRRDVERLRALGYPVSASVGVTGGYRLGAGATLPPLLLDDEEAVAVAVGLHGAAGGAVAGIGEAALRALGKLGQVLPSRLRHRLDTLAHAVVAVPPRPGPAVDPGTLTAVSAAIRAAETLRFDYVDHHGRDSRRAVQPHRLVLRGRRWYLVGWDVERDDWRTFRADRIRVRVPNGPRFGHREPPDGDVTAYLNRSLDRDVWAYRPVLRVHAPAARIVGRVDGTVTPIDDRTCRLELCTESFDLVVLVICLLDADVTVESPPELAHHLHRLAPRLAAA